MLKLALQYFGHPMGKIGGKRRRGWQRLSWLDSVTHSVVVSLSKFWESVEDRGAWTVAVPGSLRVRNALRLTSNKEQGRGRERELWTKTAWLAHSAATYNPFMTVLCWVAQSCPTLCDPMDCSLPGSSVHGILQTRILAWGAMPSSRGSSQPRDQTQVSCTAGGFFTIWTTRGAKV